MQQEIKRLEALQQEIGSIHASVASRLSDDLVAKGYLPFAELMRAGTPVPAGTGLDKLETAMDDIMRASVSIGAAVAELKALIRQQN